MYELAIRGARIVDGSGAPAFFGDLAIENGCIAAMGAVGSAHREIDGRGLTLTPGFIDIHNHSDSSIWEAPAALNYIHQGVTTMLCGNCGNSFLETFAENRELPAREDTGFFARKMDELEALKRSNHMAMLVGHGTLRAQAVGMEDVTLTESDHEAMASLLRSALDAGAFGMSSGLIYDPGIFSTPEEVSRLCRIVGEYGGLYTTHMRNESDLMVDAFLEAVEAVRGTGARLEISHLKASGRQNFGLTKTLLNLMAYYRRFGMDISCDAYPENYCHTGLASCLPGWARARGAQGFKEMMQNPETRAKLIYELDHPATEWENILRDCTAEDTILSECRRQPEFQGKTLHQAAKAMGVHPWEAAIRLCEQDFSIAIVSGGVDEQENREIFLNPLSMFCSDGSAVAENPGYKPHPRNFRSFVKPLYDFVDKRNLLPLEQAVRKMTSMPAQKIGLWDRGLLRPGMRADLALIDTYALRCDSDYGDPFHYAQGVRYLWVDGVMTLEEGEYTGATAGRLLRRGRG